MCETCDYVDEQMRKGNAGILGVVHAMECKCKPERNIERMEIIEVRERA